MNAKGIEREMTFRRAISLIRELLLTIVLALLAVLAAFVIRATLAEDAEIERLGNEAAALSDAIDATIADPVAETRGPVPEEPIAAESAPLPYTDAEIDMLARTVWAEARGCAPEEQSLVVWTVLQRADADAFPGTIEEVLLREGQFLYDEDFPLRGDIRELCLSEAGKWAAGEPAPTHPIYAPTAPYFYFNGDGKHNYFY